MAMKHDRSKTRPSEEEEEEDPVEKMIKKTGCLEYHYNVQECMADHGDWRKCQDKVQIFRQCMKDYHLQQSRSSSKSSQPKS